MSQLAVDGFRAEREAILTIAKGITAEEWLLPSACAGWTVRDVVGERDGFHDLDRASQDLDAHPERVQGGHRRVEKARDRTRLEGDDPDVAGGGSHDEPVVDEVELDLKASDAIRYRRGRQAARGDVQRDMPGMVQPGRAHQANLADDLGPQM